MGKLMEDIKRFKAMRQSAIQPLQNELDALAAIYKAINTFGQEPLRQEFSSKWERLSEQKKAELVDLLLKKDLRLCRWRMHYGYLTGRLSVYFNKEGGDQT